MAKFEFDSSGFDKILDDLKNFSFDVTCPKCGKSFEISINDSGKTVTCPNCGTDILIESE